MIKCRNEVQVVCVLKSVSGPEPSSTNVFVSDVYLNVKLASFLQSYALVF